MNEKISSGQIIPIEIALVVALFPGLINTLILNISKNASLLSVMIGIIIGLIPVLMITKISKKINNQSLKEYLIKKLGLFGKILNTILVLIAIFILFINSWLIIDFIISQFLTRTSYYFIGILFFTILAWTINKGIETISRSTFILFIITVVIMIILWSSLIPYINLENLKPYIDVEKTKILKSSLIYISYTALPIIYILDLKHITINKKTFERKIIISYLIASIIIEVFLFLIISVYTINLASILTYPVYSLFKKVQILGFIERIENFAAIQILVAFYIEAIYLLYYVKENIIKTLKIKNKKKINILTYFLSIIIPTISITIYKNYNILSTVTQTPYIIGILSIIILILFITSFKKTNSYNY